MLVHRLSPSGDAVSTMTTTNATARKAGPAVLPVSSRYHAHEPWKTTAADVIETRIPRTPKIDCQPLLRCSIPSNNQQTW